MARILVVGSDFSETQARALILEFAGHQCATASSVGEAVELLKADRSFAAILADQKLRGREAAEILRNLRIASNLKPALMVLATNADTPIQADEVLAIPCLPQEFDRALQTTLARFQARRRLFSARSRKPAGSLSGKKRAKCA
jgi:CheY-like chemotaxis protein